MEFKNTVQVIIDQDRWVMRIREGLSVNEEEVEEMQFCVCVFNVPKELLEVKPQAYIPQSVSIGPYHHWRPELYETERYKVAAARRFQKRIGGSKFEFAVEEVRKHEWRIRNCYHKYLDYKEESLAWLMALDASFLLECLDFYAVKQNMKNEISSQVEQQGRVSYPYGRSAARTAIMKDLMMLENQVPLFLFHKLLEMESGCPDEAEERLCNLVTFGCAELSPFMFKKPDSSTLRIKERGHLLEALYHSLVPALPVADTDPNGGEDEEMAPPPDKTYLTRALEWLCPVPHLLALFRNFIKATALQFLMKLPILRDLKETLTLLFESSAEKDDKVEGEEGSSVEIPPTRDELVIPCVTDLYSVGVKFVSTDGDLSTIHFDNKNATLYLPKLKFDFNTEVVLRNLIAFEASAAPDTFIFTRYTDFMNGIIDKEQDVRLLRNSGIIYNHLENDGKVASLWNGMGKCVNLTKVKYLDEVIADVNRHYNKRGSVGLMKYVNKHISGSWQFLTVFAGGILLLLTCLQAFCSVYDCKQWWKTTNLLQN